MPETFRVRRHLLVAAVLACTAFARTEEPLELVPAEDKNLTSTEPGQPHKVDGARPTLRLMGGQEKHRICMRWDFADQAAKPCGAAVLRLTTDKCWPNNKDLHIRVHRLVRPFSERWASWTDSVDHDTWINPGGDFDPQAISARKIVAKDGGEGKVLDFDVTPLVQAWQAKRMPNFGLILTLEDTSDMNIHVHSREGAAKPKLLLYYASAPPKNADMLPLTALKPLGTLPQGKTEILTQSLNRAAVGADFKAQLYAKGGIAPYAWKATGLPEGLALAEDGTLAGKPAKAGTYTLQLTVTGADKRSASGKLDLQVAEGDAKSVAGAEPAKPGEKSGPAKPEKKTGLEDE